MLRQGLSVPLLCSRKFVTPTITIRRSFLRRSVIQQQQVSSNIRVSHPRHVGSNDIKYTYNKRNPNHNNNNNSKIPVYVWIILGGCTTSICIIYVSYLDVVPITDRTRWIITSPKLEQQLGDQEYHQLIQAYKNNILPKTHRASMTVHRVGQQLALASIDFMKRYNFTSNPEFVKCISKPYTYTVIRSDMANAFVLPGNHVFVMTGLFRYVQNEDELAIIIGHEMAHNLARHMGEKISGSFVISFLAQMSLLIDPSGIIMTLLLPTMSIVRELPNSRTLEIEADHIGMLLAADACYDPRAAKNVFAAMKHGGGEEMSSIGQSPPEFLSTHPSHDTRMDKFDEWTPQALLRYSDHDRCYEIRERMKWARQMAAVDAIRRKV